MPQKLELKYLLSQIGPLYTKMIVSQEDKDSVNIVDIVIFWVENNGLNTPELLKEEAGEGNIQIVEKPMNQLEVKAIFMNDSETPQYTQETIKMSASVVQTTVEQ